MKAGETNANVSRNKVATVENSILKIEVLDIPVFISPNQVVQKT